MFYKLTDLSFRITLVHFCIYYAILKVIQQFAATIFIVLFFSDFRQNNKETNVVHVPFFCCDNKTNFRELFILISNL